MTKPEWTWRHATELRNHWWWRPGWAVGIRYYAFHLAVGDSPGLAGLVAQYQDAIDEIPDLDLIPRQWLHITMQGLGFVSDLSEEELEAVFFAAREKLSDLSPFTLTFDRPVIRPEAIVMAPDPVEPLYGLRTSIRQAIEDALGPEALDLGPVEYQPHVSFAYVSADQSPAEILRRIDAVSNEPTELHVSSVPLIEMHRDNRMYEWRNLGTLRLGASLAPAALRDMGEETGMSA